MRKGANAKPKRASKARVALPARKRPAAASLILGADCTLREAGNLKSRLLAAEPGSNGVTLDGRAVERIDTAGLQLLVAFARREAASGRPVAWVSASDELLGASARLGLLEVLGLPARTGPGS
jgi:phospholipid transport system transporter-binding protein